MTWSIAHGESEAFASAAHEAARRGDAVRATELFGRAADAEQRALLAVEPDKPRTLGITAVSAVALWYKADERERAVLLAHRASAMPGMPPFALNELRALLQAIWNIDTAPLAGAPPTSRRIPDDLTSLTLSAEAWLRSLPHGRGTGEHLQVLLAHERPAGGGADVIAALKDEILAVIGRHFPLERDKVQVKLDRGDLVSTLEMDIEMAAGGTDLRVAGQG